MTAKKNMLPFQHHNVNQAVAWPLECSSGSQAFQAASRTLAANFAQAMPEGPRLGVAGANRRGPLGESAGVWLVSEAKEPHPKKATNFEMAEFAGHPVRGGWLPEVFVFNWLI